jgi:26S proteasome regulatory subunit N2
LFSETLADPLSNQLPAEARSLASILIAKTYFYMGESAEAVEFALKAGSAFDDEAPGEFRETVIGELYEIEGRR